MITEFQNACIDYLSNLREAHNNLLATDELSLRPVLDALFKKAGTICNRPVQFVGEGKKIAIGKPDFTVTVNDLPIGYIEAEAYAVNLDKLSGHAKEQNDRFRKNLDNFLLTNHLEFRLYIGGEMVDRAILPEPPEKGKVSVTSTETEALSVLLERFLQGQLPPISSPKDLAIHLARRTRQIRNEVLNVLHDSDSPNSDMHEQYEAFREVLLPDLSEEQFAGLYAQTITYGLFAARCMPSSGPHFSRQSAAALVPKTNPFLRKLFQRIAAFDLDDRVAWIADDTAQLLAKAPMADILADFGTRSGKEDPVVHFYETFLEAYDPKVREVRGVYYTPEPVVSYIVRSIDHLLKMRFNMSLGLADERALILDPATGTGSFLFAVVRQVYDSVCQTYGVGTWNDYISNKLLPRVFGFELLIAPYAVAHLKLGLQLQELGYTFNSDQRLGIYLTNTLEEAIKKSELLLGKFISEEANEAAAIKRDRPILVMLGNPPYSGHSANRSEYIEFIPPGQKYHTETKAGKIVERTAGKNGANVRHKTFIGRLIKDYKKVDGEPLGEKNPKWLQDDYVKFIRFAQWRINQTGEGIIGYVTNHGYLDNPTFRGMRQNLIQTFNEIYVYNLHGNSRKKEKPPKGGKDENVFDIQQGVAILLCVKEKDNPQPAHVSYADLWYSREHKYQVLSETDLDNTDWTDLQPSTPFYIFLRQDTELKTEYESGWKMTDVMPLNLLGFQTHRDQIAIGFQERELFEQVRKYLKRTPEETKWQQFCRQCSYRPLDQRIVYLSKDVTDRPRLKVIQHLFKPNIAFNLVRQTKAETWKHAMVGNKPTPAVFVEIKDGSSIFPLYIYPDETTGQITMDTERRPNLSPQFLKVLAEKLNLPQTKLHELPEGITPEDIFHYAYAVFHSPTYRERYAEFLKIDFPRLPLTSDLELFRDLAELGKQLVALHLLDTNDAPVLNTPTSPFPVSGNNTVEKIRYDDTTQRVYINKTQYFDTVPSEVWEFHIGGYQVCDKWLKDRKGRQLAFDDIQHYQRIVVALSETIKLMEAIDGRIPGFPIE